jgi:hypothetical protein
MMRITFRIAHDRRILILLLILLVTVFVVGSVAASDRSARVPAEAMAFLSRGAGDMSVWEVNSFTCNHVGEVWCASDSSFYLTDVAYTPAQSLAACATGYHTASLWEILDVSNRSYAYNHPDAYVRDDSGRGPPSGRYGWVRTGFNASDSGTSGEGNCNNWTSTSSEDSGSAVRLVTDWMRAVYLPVIFKGF